MGDIDVVFNNAGYGLIGPLESFSDDQITKQLNTGFEYPQSFSKLFKKKTSLTPLEFKNSLN
jgi:NAD(P)-dependent dehydrogenase (short-subunit alcohol dehydrogenase family)